MSVTPEEPGVRHPVLRRPGARQIWRARARRAGQAGVRRLRTYLASPEGRRAITRGVGAVAVAAVAAGGIVVLRGWLAALGGRIAGLAAAARAATGALGAGVRALGRAASLRWLGGLARWLSRTAGFRRYRPCPECHSRVRWDATVCYGCGYRPGSGATLGDVAIRRGTVAGPALWLGRAAVLRLRRSCPDCRRAVHADARVCRHCGYRLRPAPRRSARPDRG